MSPGGLFTPRVGLVLERTGADARRKEGKKIVVDDEKKIRCRRWELRTKGELR